MIDSRPPSAQTLFRWQFTQTRSVAIEQHSRSPLTKVDEANLKLVQETESIEELINLILRVREYPFFKLEDKLAELCGSVEGLKKLIQNFESSKDEFQKDSLLTIIGLIIIKRRPDLPLYELLIDLFDRLRGYYKSMVAVLLGVLGDNRAADPLWNFFQKVKDTEDVKGALWGLVELNDKRVNEHLSQVLSGPEKNFFYELLPFTAKIGDKRVVGPLFRLIARSKNMNTRDEALYALAYIVKREGTGVIMNYLRSANRRVKSLAREIVSLSKETDDSFYILQMFDPIGTLPPLVKKMFINENNTSPSETR
jgi:HEAT repeat protein